MMSDEERRAWNAALVAGDKPAIDALQTVHLIAIHQKIMREDGYQERTH